MAAQETAKKPDAVASGCGCIAAGAVLIVIVAIVIAVATGGSSAKTPTENAASYISTINSPARRVRATVEDVLASVGLAEKDPSPDASDEVAATAQQAHDSLDELRSDFAQTSTTSGSLGEDELKVFSAANEFKNAMGAVVAYEGEPNAATLAHFSAPYDRAVVEWNEGVDGIWEAAGRHGAPRIPTH